MQHFTSNWSILGSFIFYSTRLQQFTNFTLPPPLWSDSRKSAYRHEIIQTVRPLTTQILLRLDFGLRPLTIKNGLLENWRALELSTSPPPKKKNPNKKQKTPHCWSHFFLSNCHVIPNIFIYVDIRVHTIVDMNVNINRTQNTLSCYVDHWTRGILSIPFIKVIVPWSHIILNFNIIQDNFGVQFGIIKELSITEYIKRNLTS